MAGAEAPGAQEGLAGWPGTWLSLPAGGTEEGREGRREGRGMAAPEGREPGAGAGLEGPPVHSQTL